uniref:Uncharacterized protein n=3 Tax=Aegilops tauschii subsp. strangulata TaxID=200361 RepID=A0A453BCD6_AEGTS
TPQSPLLSAVGAASARRRLFVLPCDSTSDQDMQLYIVVTRLACIAFSTAAFVLAMAAPACKLKGSMLTLMSWTSMRIVYQAICFYFGALNLDCIAPILFNDSVRSYLFHSTVSTAYSVLNILGDFMQARMWLFMLQLVMLLAYGASCAGTASVFFLHHFLHCQRLPLMTCPMYFASSVLGLVAVLFNAATTLRLLWARCSRHHED